MSQDGFDLTADQRALRRTAHELCERAFPIAVTRAYGESGELDRSLWTELTKSGLFTLHQPADQGGLDLGRAGLAIAFEEIGAALVAGPVVSTAITAGLIEHAKPDAVVGVVAVDRPAPFAVEHLDALDHLVLLDTTEVRVVDRAALDASIFEPAGAPLDPLTPYRLTDHLPTGPVIGGAELNAVLRRDGALLVAAQAAGLAAAATDRAARYALEREQFGRQIGAFQAVKHLLADMMVRAELAQAAVESAAVLIDEGDASADEAVSAAKIVAGEAAVENGRSCVQVHGGMGFAWEVDAHLYQKRAWALDQAFGGRSVHARRLITTWSAIDGREEEL